MNAPSESTGSATPPATPIDFVQRALIFVAIAASVVVLFRLAWRVVDVLLLLFASILFGLFLSGASSWLRKHTPLSHRQALAIVVLALLAVVGVGGWLTAPGITEQAQRLPSNLRDAVERLETTLSNQSWAQPILNQLPDPEQFNTSLNSFLNRIFRLFSRTLNLFTSAAVVLFVGFYLAAEPELYTNGLIRLAPISYRPRAGEVLDETAYTLRRWLLGRLASMLIVGVLWALGLLLIGVPLPLILGILAGILEFIPIIGPILILIPTILIALPGGASQMLYVLLLYAVVQVVESYMITPLIQRETISLPPVLLIMSQLVFGLLFGFVGLLVAAPVTAMILVLTKMLYLEDILGDARTELQKARPEPRFEASKNPQGDRHGERRRPRQTKEVEGGKR